MTRRNLALSAAALLCILWPGVVGQGVSRSESTQQMLMTSLGNRARSAVPGSTVPVTLTFDGTALATDTVWMVNLVYAGADAPPKTTAAVVVEPFLATFRGESGRTFSVKADLPGSGTVLVQVLEVRANRAAPVERWWSRSAPLRGKQLQFIVSARPGDRQDITVVEKP